MTVQLHYDAQTDAAYLRFSNQPVIESEEIAPGLAVDYDSNGRMVAIEVLQARARLQGMR